MKYFFLETDFENNTTPTFTNWYREIKKEYIQSGAFHKLPKWSILSIKVSEEANFPDIFTYPVFLISEMVRDVMKAYLPELNCKRVILFDKETKVNRLYYLPNIEAVQCLGTGSVCNPDKSRINHAILDREKIKEKVIFRIGDVRDSYFVVRMDFIESVIRRNAICIALKDIIVM